MVVAQTGRPGKVDVAGHIVVVEVFLFERVEGRTRRRQLGAVLEVVYGLLAVALRLVVVVCEVAFELQDILHQVECHGYVLRHVELLVVLIRAVGLHARNAHAHGRIGPAAVGIGYQLHGIALVLPLALHEHLARVGHRLAVGAVDERGVALDSPPVADLAPYLHSAVVLVVPVVDGVVDAVLREVTSRDRELDALAAARYVQRMLVRRGALLVYRSIPVGIAEVFVASRLVDAPAVERPVGVAPFQLLVPALLNAKRLLIEVGS